MSPTFLTESGYRFDAKPQVRVVGPEAKTVQNGDGEQKQTTSGRSASQIVGVWEYKGQLGNQEVDLGLCLRAEGRMAFVMITKGANGQPVQLKSVGQWHVDGWDLILTDESGTNRFKYWMVGEQLAIQFRGQERAALFHRVQG
jgi:hypothetical protein